MPPTPVILTTRDLRFRIDDQVILDGISLTLHDRERVGLLGRNGAGKTTLLKILAAAEHADTGEVLPRRDLRIGWLPQEARLNPELTVRDAILEGARDIQDMITRYEALPHDAPLAHELEHRIHQLDGWNLENRLEGIMDHLEVPPADRIVGTLSGGECRRTALARALIGRPDLLILDEPTNHLDTESIEWLENFLRTYPGGCLLVTHDRYFLDRIATRIFELSQGTLYAHEGNYTSFLTTKAEREEQTARVENKRQTFLRRELDWIRRGPKARTTKSQARIDRFYNAAGQKTPDEEKDIELVIPPPPEIGNRALDAENLTVVLGDRTLVRNATFQIPPGARVGIIGRNGAGKTTLLRVLLGEIPPTSGTLTTGNRVAFNYVDQHRLRLNDNNSVLEEVAEGKEFVQLGEERVTVWGYLRRFLFEDSRIQTKVGKLSGGERSRLLLAKILKHGGNVLILDEPTNDLDLATLRMLEEALADFAGCILLVSHDRYFLNRVCTAILAFEADGRLVWHEGDYDYYREKRNAAMRRAPTPAIEAAKPAAPAVAAATAKPTAVPDAPKKRKLKWAEERELEALPAAIEVAEAEVARMETLFASPDFFQQHGPRIKELTAELDAAHAKAAKLYTRWNELDSASQ